MLSFGSILNSSRQLKGFLISVAKVKSFPAPLPNIAIPHIVTLNNKPPPPPKSPSPLTDDDDGGDYYRYWPDYHGGHYSPFDDDSEDQKGIDDDAGTRVIS